MVALKAFAAGLAGALIIAVGIAAVDPLETRVDNIETRVAVLEDLHGITPEPSPSPTSESTATVPPTNTPEPTATSTPEPTATATAPSVEVGEWHPPTDHEHGDPPPQWVTDWSMAQFGHGVIYGGDEATPGEWTNKPRAFKGYSFVVRADDGTDIDVYARLHMQTNPHGRSARYHSCEWYFRDETEAVSFMQWWCDFGELRLSFAQEGQNTGYAGIYSKALLLDESVIATNPLNVIIGYDAVANPGYVAGYTGREFWYAQVSPGGDWMPTFTVDVYGPSTYYQDGEEETATDPSTWQLTGDYGLDRRIGFRWIAGGSTIQNIQGQPYLNRNIDDPRGWFCATVYGAITDFGSSDCLDGSIPQYIALTLPTIADSANPPRYYRHTWACPDCELPN